MFDGEDLLALNDAGIRKVRGGKIAMIFQDPMTALNPVFTVGDQIQEMLVTHNAMPKSVAAKRAVELLEMVGVPEPQRRADQYPHEFSGGMRQRAMIAMAIANNPRLLIADEPTTALDVTIQAQVMEVIADVQKETGAAMILITHDLGLVAGSAERVQVMYGSRGVRARRSRRDLLRQPQPVHAALLRSIPSAGERQTERLHPIPATRRASCVRCPAAPSGRAARWRSTAASRRCRNC